MRQRVNIARHVGFHPFFSYNRAHSVRQTPQLSILRHSACRIRETEWNHIDADFAHHTNSERSHSLLWIVRLRSPFLLPDQCQVPTELHLFYCYTIEVSVTIPVYEAKPFYSFGIWALVSNECEAHRDLLRQVKLNRASEMCSIFGPVKIGSMAQDGRRKQEKNKLSGNDDMFRNRKKKRPDSVGVECADS